MTTTQHNINITEESVREALREVMDPEIPNLSIVDLGIVHKVEVGAEGVRVDILPTFVGCPALEMMKENVQERLRELAPDVSVSVKVTMDVPWTSDRISEKGRAVLNNSGFAPPPTGKMPSRGNLIQ